MIVLGIDPGLDGALAWLDERGIIEVRDLPTLSLMRSGRKVRQLDLTELPRLLRVIRPGLAVIEQVASSPQMGVASSFSFGFSYGGLLGAIGALQLPWQAVRPQTWKKHMQIAKGAGKDASRHRASQLFPSRAGLWSRAKDDGRAEAVLIALYGQQAIVPSMLPL